MKKIYLALFFVMSCLLIPVTRAEISVSSYRTAPQTLPKNAVRVPFLKIRVSAVDEDAWISGFKIQRGGLSSSQDVGRIWAESESGFKSRKRTLTNDDIAELTFRKSIKIPKGRNQIFQIYANLNIEGSGKTVSLSLNDLLIPAFSSETTTQKTIKKPTVQKKRKSKIYCKNQKCYRLR